MWNEIGGRMVYMDREFALFIGLVSLVYLCMMGCGIYFGGLTGFVISLVCIFVASITVCVIAILIRAIENWIRR